MNKLQISTFLIAVCIAVVATAAVKQKKTEPCTTPSQWEGRASEYDHITGNNNRFLISFDGVNKMKRFIEERRSFMPGKRWYEYIQHYNKNRQYKINLSDKTCDVTKLAGTWQNHTIPVNATLEDQYVMGDANQQFSVSEWSDRVPGRKKEAWIGAFTDTNCWPVFEVFNYNDPDSEYSVSTSTRFFDLETGIKNMSVFTPPDICKEPPPVDTFVNEVEKITNGFNTEYIDTFFDFFKNTYDVLSDWWGY